MKTISRGLMAIALSMIPGTLLTSTIYTTLLSDETIQNYHRTMDTVHDTIDANGDKVDLSMYEEIIGDYEQMIDEILKTVE